MNAAPSTFEPAAAVATPSAPVATVIVTAYNQERFIGAALRSVLTQSCASLQCIVVDDGSTDGTRAAALAAAAGDPRVQVLTQPNAGPSAARNHGYRRAHPAAAYLVFLDGDDRLAPDFITALSAHLDRHPDVGLVTCAYVVMDDAGELHGPGRRTRYAPGRGGFPRALPTGEIETPFEAFYCATGQGPFAVLRRSVFARTGGYDEGFWPHEDTDLFCQMAWLARAHHLELPLYWKREHGGSILRTESAAATARFAAFRADAYARFRRKWDERPSPDRTTQARLHAAKVYYLTRHRPARDLKVAALALREFCTAADPRKLAWCGTLVASALRGFFTPRRAVPLPPLRETAAAKGGRR